MNLTAFNLRRLLLCALLPVTLNSYATDTITISPEHYANLGVTLGTLTPVSHLPLLSAPAIVAIPPAHEYVVSAPQAGLITTLTAATGDLVKKGEVIAQLTSPDLLTMQGRYLKASSAFSLANAAYQRDKKLLQEGVIANRREQESLSYYNAASLELNEAQQMLSIAGMSPADIKQLADTHQFSSHITIHAPLNGVVLERPAAVGTRIDILAPLYRLANLTELWLDIAIPQEKISKVKIGDEVTVDNSPLRAEIRLLGQRVNTENQTVMARAILKGDFASARAGQRVTIQIIQDTGNNAFQIPNTAIAQNEGKAFVFTRSDNGFSVIPVNVLAKLNDDSIVTGPFNGSETLAIKGAVALKANWLGLGSDE